jgi:hypothetical protein
MPVIVTTIHDPLALRATCTRLDLEPPTEGSVSLGNYELFGWVLYLAGLHAPLVCDTLTGLVAYHQRDNEFHRFRRIMRFVHRYYDIRAQMRRPGASSIRAYSRRRLAPTCAAA